MIPLPSNDHDKPSVLGIAVQASSAAQPNAIADPDYLLVFSLQHRDDNRPPSLALATAHRQQSNTSSHISSARSARPLSQFARNIDCRSARSHGPTSRFFFLLTPATAFSSWDHTKSRIFRLNIFGIFTTGHTSDPIELGGLPLVDSSQRTIAQVGP
ncbi:hypothetical protein NDA13_004267 [Ustilago tritici]|nr:hypothetical protein NDA13_004267 [Ustilago tritici]